MDFSLQSELEYLSFMYTNACDFIELKKRVEDLYKEHEKELLEVFFHQNLKLGYPDDNYKDICCNICFPSALSSCRQRKY